MVRLATHNPIQEINMENQKGNTWRALLAGFLSYCTYRIFWDYIYPHLGVEWNRYIVMAVFFLSFVALYVYDKKRREKKRQE